jgi:5-methylcytosine-specific restriction endonuclease McrA
MNKINKRKISLAKAKNAYKHLNTEKGFVKNRISLIFTPSKIKQRGYVSESTKEEIFEHFNKYIKIYGKNCFYCKKPWVYSTNLANPGGGKQFKGKSKINRKNFSIDRLDSSKTYNIDNIIFCCTQCNLSKKDISIKLIKRLHEIITERNL